MRILIFVLFCLGCVQAATESKAFFSDFLQEWTSSSIKACLIGGTISKDFSSYDVVRRYLALTDLEWRRSLAQSKCDNKSPRKISDVQWIVWKYERGEEKPYCYIKSLRALKTSKKVICVSMGSEAFNRREDIIEIKKQCYKFVEGEKFQIIMRYLSEFSNPLVTVV